MQESDWGIVLDEFLHIGSGLLLIIAAVAIITGLVRHYVPQEKLQEKLSKHESKGPIIGALMGILTPFCSAAMIPVMIGMVQMGIATGTVFSFLISSPLTNFVVVGLIAATFGIKVAFIYFLLTFLGAIAAGYIVSFTSLRNAVKRDIVEPKQTCSVSTKKNEVKNLLQVEDQALGLVSCSSTPVSGYSSVPACSLPSASQKTESHKERLGLAIQFAWALFKKITPYVLIGAAISALSAAFLPADIVERFVGSDNWFAIPIAAVISIPLYLRIEMALPLLDVLIGKGMGMGAAMALIIGGTGASLPGIAIMSAVLKPRAVIAFVAIVLAIATIGGMIFSFVL